MPEFSPDRGGNEQVKCMKGQRLNRRTMLRGTGGALLALPYLDAMAQPGSADEVPMRMACVGMFFGIVPDLFFPKQTGRDYELSERLVPLKDLRDDFTVFSGLDHGANGTGGHQGTGAYLTGLRRRLPGRPEANISVDQKAAQIVGAQTRYPSMQFSDNGRAPISRKRNGSTCRTVSDVQTIYNLLFQKSDPKQNDTRRREFASSKSMLDLVKTDADNLKRRIGPRDRQKLEQYFDTVRDVEKDLVQTEQWLDRPKPEVDYKLPNGASSFGLNSRMPLYYDLMALALQTDSTRIITLALHIGHHPVTHHGKDPATLAKLSIIEQYQMEQLARFLAKLKSIDEPNGKTLLDNCMVLFGSGIGNASSHSNKNLPLLLAGGGFAHGEHKSYFKGKSSTLAARLFVSMLQRFGVETDEFAMATSTLTGLETRA